VLVHKLGHLEHVDHRLAAETALRFSSALDVPPVLGVLELVLLNVGHSFLVTFGPRGNRLLPTTSDSAALGVIGFRMPHSVFLADFFAAFLAISTPSIAGRGAPPDPSQYCA
jgi:hypothetical protein